MLNWLPLSLQKPASLTNLTNSLLAKLGTPPLGTPKVALPRQATGREWDTASDRTVSHPAPVRCYNKQEATLNTRRIGCGPCVAAAFAVPAGFACQWNRPAPSHGSTCSGGILGRVSVLQLTHGRVSSWLALEGTRAFRRGHGRSLNPPNLEGSFLSPSSNQVRATVDRIMCAAVTPGNLPAVCEQCLRPPAWRRGKSGTPGAPRPHPASSGHTHCANRSCTRLGSHDGGG